MILVKPRSTSARVRVTIVRSLKALINRRMRSEFRRDLVLTRGFPGYSMPRSAGLRLSRGNLH